MSQNQGAGIAMATYQSNDSQSVGQSFHVNCINLKPNTAHTFIFDGVDNTNNCIMTGSSSFSTANGLVTDKTGKIQFDFYMKSSVSANVASANKKFELTASNSYCSTVININNLQVQTILQYGTNNS